MIEIIFVKLKFKLYLFSDLSYFVSYRRRNAEPIAFKFPEYFGLLKSAATGPFLQISNSRSYLNFRHGHPSIAEGVVRTLNAIKV